MFRKLDEFCMSKPARLAREAVYGLVGAAESFAEKTYPTVSTTIPRTRLKSFGVHRHRSASFAPRSAEGGTNNFD